LIFSRTKQERQPKKATDLDPVTAIRAPETSGNDGSRSAAIRGFIEPGLAEPSSGQGKMAAIEELEHRVRYVESEIEGEKLITRRVYDQAVRNGDQIGALRSEVATARSEIATARLDIQALTSRIDHIAQEVVQNTAALRNHGTLLTLLQQDVTALRNDATALRRGQEELHVRIDQMHVRIDQMHVRIDQMQAQLDQMQAQLDQRLDQMQAQLDQMQAGVTARFNRLDSKLDAILAAMTPRT
jgi:chromosome segregation ATPase